MEQKLGENLRDKVIIRDLFLDKALIFQLASYQDDVTNCSKGEESFSYQASLSQVFSGNLIYGVKK